MLMVICGDDCVWGRWAKFWFACFLATFLLLSIKLIDARHAVVKLQAQEAK